MHAHTHTHSHRHTQTQTHRHTCTNRHTDTERNTDRQTHTHTHTHTYKYLLSPCLTLSSGKANTIQMVHFAGYKLHMFKKVFTEKNNLYGLH